MRNAQKSAQRTQGRFELSDTNPYAKQVIDAWANGAWFIAKPKLANRPDIPLHALVC